MTSHSEAKKFSTLHAYLVGAAAIVGTAATLIVGVGSLGVAWCNNIGVFCGPIVKATPDSGPPTDVSATPDSRLSPDLTPYGVDLVALTDPFQAVQDADKAKAIAPAGAQIRLYKRLTRAGTFAWAPVVLYTDNSVAGNELAKFKGQNGWDDPKLITIRTWCPKSRSIPSPTGTPINIAVFDCT
jgi:hypothetical protein